jgi:hypothetical protein
MRHGRFPTIGALAAAIAGVSLAAVTVRAQSAAKAPAGTGKAWTAPRAADGHPDLSGVWAHNSATPLERPPELAGRPLLTDEELAAMKRTAAQLFNGNGDAAFGDTVYLAALKNVLGKEKGFKSTDVTTGDYNSFWIVDREFDNRTSLISDPPDGKIPPLTAEAQKRRSAEAERRRLHPFDGPEDIALGERCITGYVPMMGAGYNNYYQIAQAPGYVAIDMEMRHDTRMIPTDGRPHVPSNLGFWLGDSRGRWEGDTLVVDTTNFRDDTSVGRGNVNTSAKAHVIERFTRVGPDTLKYQVTIDDPATWTKPWTAELFMKSSKDQIYEYACHEGNEAMSGTLAGARAQEKQAEHAGKTTGSK